jgi:hypothetical protein
MRRARLVALALLAAACTTETSAPRGGSSLPAEDVAYSGGALDAGTGGAGDAPDAVSGGPIADARLGDASDADPFPDAAPSDAAGPTDGAAYAAEDASGKPPAPGDHAEVAAASFPDDIPCGVTALATLTMRNAGTTTWSREAGVGLGAVDDDDPLYHLDTRVRLPEGVSVAPGETWTFEIPLLAPAVAGEWHTDWRMVREFVHWFGEVQDAQVSSMCGGPKPSPAEGMVTLDGHSLSDAKGRFNALGASLFWAAWGYKHDLPRLEANLAYLADNGFEYIRALGVVGDPNGPDYWDGREIVWTWPDYASVIAGLTDLAWQKYGLRVQWTLIGDGQVSIPAEADRYALVDTFVAMSQGREDAIVLFEIANEAWQNGFAGDEGLAQLRALSATMRSKTPILVAASAPDGHECDDGLAIYAGDIADIATIHFDRDVGKADGHWRPVRQPWEHQFCGLPVGSNNEPIGPGASVNTEDDPLKLVAAAIVTHIASLPMYVFHSSAGVRGDSDIWEMAGAGAFQHLDALVPGDLASWSPQNCHWEGSPFICYAGDSQGALVADTMWPDLASPTSGAVRVYSATDGGEFLSAPIGILGHVTLEARKSMIFDVIHPVSGQTLATHSLSAGETVEIGGAEALVLRGTFL